MNLEFDRQMERLRDLRAELETGAQEPIKSKPPLLFESPPEGCTLDCAKETKASQSQTRLPPIQRSSIDPNLEQATLDELNSALAQAFEQMAGN